MQQMTELLQCSDVGLYHLTGARLHCSHDQVLLPAHMFTVITCHAALTAECGIGPECWSAGQTNDSNSH